MTILRLPYWMRGVVDPAMYAFSAEKISWLACAGLLWDLAGAFFLAKALVFGKDHLIRRQAGTYYGLSIPLLKAQVEQRIDARYGITQLATGFVLQFASSFGVSFGFMDAVLWSAPIALVYGNYCHNFHRSVLIGSMRIAATGINEVEMLTNIETWLRFYNDVEPQVVIDARRYVLRNYAAKSLLSASKGFCSIASRDASFDIAQAVAKDAPKKTGPFRQIDGGNQMLLDIAAEVMHWASQAYPDAQSRGAIAAQALSDAYTRPQVQPQVLGRQ